MRNTQAIFAAIVLIQQCSSLPLEESVVSVYTTHPTTLGTNPPLDVYHQIASNLAERITSPIYKFLGINSSKPPETSTKAWSKIEILDDSDISEHEVKTVDNDISKQRDIEELSVEGLKHKTDKKPEKITLYSSYLPVLARASESSNEIERIDNNVEIKNDTYSEFDEEWNFDEDGDEKPREGPFIYMLEFFGSIVQLVVGGISALFKSSGSSSA